MQLIGILYGAFNGRMQEITDAVLSASREAVTLCVTMTGILAFWQGLMEIAKDAGLTDVLWRKDPAADPFSFSGDSGGSSGV